MPNKVFTRKQGLFLFYFSILVYGGAIVFGIFYVLFKQGGF